MGAKLYKLYQLQTDTPASPILQKRTKNGPFAPFLPPFTVKEYYKKFWGHFYKTVHFIIFVHIGNFVIFVIFETFVDYTHRQCFYKTN
jgi:hypothetical protein